MDPPTTGANWGIERCSEIQAAFDSDGKENRFYALLKSAVDSAKLLTTDYDTSNADMNRNEVAVVAKQFYSAMTPMQQNYIDQNSWVVYDELFFTPTLYMAYLLIWCIREWEDASPDSPDSSAE